MKLITLILLLTIWCSMAEEEKGSTSELKPWAAVTDFNKIDGFKLSAVAEKNLGVTYETLKGEAPWVVPKSAILTIKHSKAVFRKWKGWSTMVLVKIIEEDQQKARIRSLDLQSGDQVAITGVPFLRMTEADLNSDTVDACSH